MVKVQDGMFFFLSLFVYYKSYFERNKSQSFQYEKNSTLNGHSVVADRGPSPGRRFH